MTEQGEYGTAGRVLLVDDEDRIRLLTKLSLQTLGFEIVEAENGQEALRKVASGDVSFCVAVIDMNMPGLNGAETLRQIRGYIPKLPALICSGIDQGRFNEFGLEPDATRFLQKPFTLRQLKSLLSDLLPEMQEC